MTRPVGTTTREGDRVRDQILAYVRSNPSATFREIALAIDRAVFTAHWYTTRLEGDGRLERSACGECGRVRWTIPVEAVA